LAVEREKPDAILFGSDVALPVVAAQRAQLERDFDVQVVVPRPRWWDPDDKYRTYEF
jgi:hypothetical protein